jgi:ankyrin repeat protein
LEVRLFALLEETPPNLKKIENVIREGVNENGLTPLLRLVQKEEGDLLQVIPLLLKRGIDVNHKDEDGWNVLFFLRHHYQEDNMIEIIKLLIEHGIDVNCKDNNGKNVLHLLCKYYQKENLVGIIRLLTAHDFDVNLKNKENILHFYCAEYEGENFIDIVEVFIEKGVEVVSGGINARRMVRNKKYPKRSNVEKIIELMDTKC